MSRPFLRFNRAKIGGRASLIKLANGDLFVISPTPIEEGTQQWVDSIGTVKYLASPNVEVRSIYVLSLSLALYVTSGLEGGVS